MPDPLPPGAIFVNEQVKLVKRCHLRKSHPLQIRLVQFAVIGIAVKIVSKVGLRPFPVFARFALISEAVMTALILGSI